MIKAWLMGTEKPIPQSRIGTIKNGMWTSNRCPTCNQPIKRS